MTGSGGGGTYPESGGLGVPAEVEAVGNFEEGLRDLGPRLALQHLEVGVRRGPIFGLERGNASVRPDLQEDLPANVRVASAGQDFPPRPLDVIAVTKQRVTGSGCVSLPMQQGVAIGEG